jgi:hypothetical protein
MIEAHPVLLRRRRIGPDLEQRNVVVILACGREEYHWNTLEYHWTPSGTGEAAVEAGRDAASLGRRAAGTLARGTASGAPRESTVSS